MEIEDILNLDRLQCTGDRATGGWYLDQDAILAAIDKLGIKMQVRIRFHTNKYTYGTHRNRKDHHKIILNQADPPAEASNTIWHELAHCLQSEQWAERTGKDITNWHHADYKQVDGEHGRRYRGNLYEIEANKLADDNADFSLVIFAP